MEHGTLLHRFTNTEDGTEVLIVTGPKGFNVVLRDTDADKTVGFIRMYPTEEGALAYAATLQPVCP